MPYTRGVICSKVQRYEERVFHPDRLRVPLIRTGPKGRGQFREASWGEAMDVVEAGFRAALDAHGPLTVWPYYYAGTMGLVQRDGLRRLTRALGWSDLDQTICSSLGKAGLLAGLGGGIGCDPRDMLEAELIVVWGMNPVYTQINVMTHIAEARRRGAKLVVIDPHRTATAEKADLHLAVSPGSDGALACAMMQVMLQEGLADRSFLAERTDFGPAVEAHLATRTPEWAAPLTGLPAETIRAFAREYGAAQRSFIRTGYGMTRARDGAHRLHAVSCLPAVSGAWRHRGGGFLASSSGNFSVDSTLIEGKDLPPSGRTLDMSQIGRILTGDPDALRGGPPVTAMITQSTNPAAVAPESNRVLEGLSREDLFLCVHEQFMTDTARYADVVLPATSFLEHADMYTSYGHTFLQVAKPVLPVFGEAWENHQVVCELARRLGAEHPGFGMSAWELVDATLLRSGYPGAEALYEQRWLDASKDERAPRLEERFATPDGRFRFRPDWRALGDVEGRMPELPDHWEVADRVHPFRLVAGPARHFLNSSFTETPGGQKREGRPTVKLHPRDAEAHGITTGSLVTLGNDRGQVKLHAEVSEAAQSGVLVVESVWPHGAFVDGVGINALTSADVSLPAGGAAFHDTSVWLLGPAN